MAIYFVITVAVGVLGGLLLYRLKVPAGVLVGAILAVSILSVSTGAAVMPSNAKLFAQIITGAYIGTGITKQDVLHLPHIIKPFLVVVINLLILNILMGFIIHAISPLDLITSMMCALPGGISDTPLIAMALGADAAKVAVMQFVRMTFGIGVLPLIIAYTDNAIEKKADFKTPARRSSRKEKPAAPKQKRSVIPLLITLAVTAVFGIIGNRTSIPAGAMVVGMIAAMVLKMIYSEAYLPLWCRRVAQVSSGCVIGCRIKYEDVLELRFLILPAILIVVGYIVNCIVTGVLINKLFKISRLQGMLSASPAGATEMALIAADLGITSPDVVVLQLCRLMAVMAIFPQILAPLAAAFS